MKRVIELIKEYINGFKGKKVGFIGCGISNMPIIELFAAAGIDVSVRDKKDNIENLARLRELCVKIITGESYLDCIDESVIFLSPGVRGDLLELTEVKKNGTVLTTEMEEFFKLCKEKKAVKTIAVTGSDGKTTTTTLISEILKASGKRVHIGGNIGKNLLATLDDISDGDFVVAELSSFQLMKMTVSPEIAVVTNISQNHLDWHRDMEEYIEAKTNIFNFQGKNDLLILNYDDEITREFSKRAKGRVKFFSAEKKLDDGIYLTEKGLYNKNELLLSQEDILLVGIYNKLHYAAAIEATEGYYTKEGLQKVAGSFKGVEHRCELVRNKNGVLYYNSSIDSSPSRTTACLHAFENKVIVICGGYDKKIPLEPLGPLFLEKAKAVILMGDTADKIDAILKNAGYRTCYRANDMVEAVKIAERIADIGDSVVLSPAAASFDMYKNFEERGNLFKKIVNRL
ncbi:MAG: UDP-N-acetylmuramoyl-L-alanine--D-glutamate ligase [Eubacteriales bacterium]|mgnify:CR=1 FL=1|nr:UDP-N-acetylmuramoyl-L-alanine--D-glutamate ligase [Eubacteriales bacterium]MDD4422575.1 UDP-N-acetylmuramoyl-L-alanine--D-glutamate ligase [Eubacteriales bacterium]HBR31237.1 UDP-N-acetylmuramoyl-L-alanine--D-glutamate ligase [Clostridiales bacterium]